MSCTSSSLARGVGLAALLSDPRSVSPASAQKSFPADTPSRAFQPLRAPIIGMVQPGDGGVVPQDTPVVVFRFAPGESSDPLDLRSLLVTVDGYDCSARFQASATEAWGSLAAISGRDARLAPGPHLVTARICSARGVCGTTSNSVSVVVNRPAPERPLAEKRVRELLRFVLTIIRKLLA